MIHKILLGAKRYRQCHPGSFLFYMIAECIWIVLLLLNLTTGRGSAWTPLLVILWLLFPLRIFYMYSQDPETTGTELAPPSHITPQEYDELSMKAATWTGDPGYNLLHLPDFRTEVDTVYITFVNRTGAPIVTDTSFTLERKTENVWRTLSPLPGKAAEWDVLELATGTTEHVPFQIGRLYDKLYQGDYRIIKTLRINDRSYILAADFLLN